MSAIASLHDVTVSYERHPAIHHVTTTIEQGTLTAITGPNGGGKTTLLKTIAGLIKAESGAVKCDVPQNKIAFLPQSLQVTRDFPITTAEMVSMGAWNRKLSHKTLQDKVAEALVAVGLEGFNKRTIASLSLGQLQRALFARLILQDAQLLLLDEPFSAVDEETLHRLLHILHSWQKEGRTILCVMHHLSCIEEHFPRCMVMARKLVAHDDTKKLSGGEYFKFARGFQEAWNPEAEICEL